MGLKIKNFTEVLISMTDYVSRKSKRLLDFSEGSVLRTIFEAVAMEFEEYYFKMYNNMLYAMENAVYEAFGFEKRPAVNAYGTVTLYFTNPLPDDLIINSGTRFTATIGQGEILTYQTRESYLIPRGSVSADITVYCQTPGSIGNVLENTIVNLATPVSWVNRVTNNERFLTGRDEETDEERKQRFNKYVETRSKGTIAAIEYGTLEVEEVTGVWVDESRAGLIYVYAHDEAGNLPDTVKEKIEKNLINYRPASIPVFVLPIHKIDLDVNLDITVLYEYDSPQFRNKVRQEIQNFLNSFRVSQDFISSDLNNFVRELDKNAITNCIIRNPEGDFEVQPSELIRSGSINLNFIVV